MGETKLRFGEILVRAGVLEETRLNAALAEQKKWGGRLGRVLVDMGFVDESTVVAALSRHLRIPAIDLLATPPPANVTDLLSVQYCERYSVFPVGADLEHKVLRLATSDPTNFGALRDLEFRTGMKIEPVVAGAFDIDRAVRRYYYGDDSAPSRTAQPADFAMRERTFTPEPIPAAPDAAAAPATAPALMPSPAPSAPPELLERVARLEELASKQARALRALVEMLVDANQLDRAEYVRRVRNEGGD